MHTVGPYASPRNGAAVLRFSLPPRLVSTTIRLGVGGKGPNYEIRTVGPDFERVSSQIQRVRVVRRSTETKDTSGIDQPAGIVAGPDGALWFANAAWDTEGANGSIGRITTGGVITIYRDNHPYQITGYETASVTAGAVRPSPAASD